MKVHANAPLGPKGRHTMVLRVVDDGWPPARAGEAAATGATAVATACPFCTTMLSDGAAANGDDVEVLDVAQLLLAAVRRGDPAPAD